MEDLTGLTFTPSTAPNTQPKSAPPNQTRFPQNTPTTYAPIPSRGTPNYNLNLHLPRPQQQSVNNTPSPQRNVSSKTDSFASLSAFSGISRAGVTTSNTTLEQQRLAREKEKRDKLEKEKKDIDLHFGADEFWEKHSRQNTPTIITTDTSKSSQVDLTAFSSDAPVSTASHFPPPPDNFGTTVDRASASASVQDPFDMSGFGESLARTRYHTSPGYLETTNSNSTDDILGVLAQPVETFTKPKPATPKPVSPSPKPVSRPIATESSGEEEDTERDRAIASIVEMGFTIGQATKALSQTSSGIDVQQALNTLLSRPSSSASVGRPTSSSSARLERPPPGRRRTPDPSARTREQQLASQQKDISQIAGVVGSSLLKGAGSLWKSGREKVNTLIQEYNGEMEDPSVPKWMREQQRHASARRTQDVVTDEARALEARDGKASTRRNGVHRSEAMEREGSRPGSGSGVPKDRVALRKQVEEEAEMGYRSSSRRRPPNRTNTPSQDPPSRSTTPSTKPPAPTIDLFSSTTEDIPKSVSQRPSRTQTPPSRPIPTNPSTPKPQRVVPPTSDSALSSSHTSRQKGSEAFKVGDYSLALTYYTSALNPLPSSHPQRIIILSNRAITNIKLGDAKAAILDCDDLIREVGSGRGEGEMVSDIDGAKSLREIWGKGVIRRAMALEMLEKYSEALEMWKVAVDVGIGGAPSLEGKRRCESALGIKSTQAASMSRSSSAPLSRGNTPAPRVPARSSTPVVRPKVTRPAGPSASENLAQYNKSVAADEDEKTRLYDTVDARITTWKTGKESNIRALLSSLDGVLWAEAGWKKVSMAELVVVNKVKIVYMKAIAKLHPDKIPTNATVEQKMIAAAVFAIINDAYNIFKEQNGL